MKCFPALIIIAALTTLFQPALQASDCLGAESCTSHLPWVSSAAIALYPEPDGTPLTVDENVLYDRRYQQINGSVEIFDAPGGAVTGRLEAGFNFVTVLQTQDGWTEINPGQWVRSENLADSNGVISHFSGVLLSDSTLPYPMGWALINFHPSKTPGGEPSESLPLVYRYTRINLYASVEVDGYRWYQIGVDQWVHQFNVAKIIPLQRPDEVDTDFWISLDLYEQVLIAYQGQTPVFATLIATGMERWPTREGLYHIYFRKTRDHMSGGKPGDDFYYLEEVPWTMFFDEGRALHGAYWHDGFGYRRSHGCVNLSITDARWLYDRVAEELGTRASADRENGPAVYIYSSGVY